MDDSDARQMQQLKPLNFYGQSKQWMDLHALKEGWLERIVGLKYFNVFGPNENHKGDMRSLVCKSYADVLKTGIIRLFKSHRPEYPDGEQRRDFLYVKDAVAMTLHLAANSRANGIFNVGSGQARSWNDLACAVFSALGREPHIEYIDMPEAIRDKYQYFTEANIGKLRASGYDLPITSLEDAVRDYVVEYLVPGRTIGV
jgi:ADP-L-glycero-D-manno-heptose 6-epimerase